MAEPGSVFELSQPENLAEPIPGEEQAQGQLIAQLTSLDQLEQRANEIRQRQQVEPRPEETAVPGVVRTPPPADAVGEPGQITSLEELNTKGAQISAMQQIRPRAEEASFLERLQVAGAVTDTEFVNFWEKKFGEGTAEVDKDGTRRIRRSTKEGFIKLDPDEFEFFKDTLADFSRIGIETTAAIGTELAVRSSAAVAGGVAGGPLGAVSGFVGSGPAAGAASGIVAQGVGDAYQAFLGIPRDPEREGTTELALAGGLGAVFGSFGRVVDFMFKSRAPAKEAIKKQIEQGEEYTRQVVNETIESVKAINESVTRDGMRIGFFKEGEELVLAPHQVAPEDSIIKGELREILNVPGFQQWQANQGRLIEDAYTTVTRSQNPVLENQILEQAEKQGKRGLKRIGQRLQESADEFVKREGKIIDKITKEAEITDNLVPTPNVRNAINGVFEELGIRREGNVLVGLSAKEISKKTGMKPAQARIFATKLAKLNGLTFNQGDKLRPSQAKELIDEMSRIIDLPAFRKRTATFDRWLKSINSSLRSDRRNVVGENIADPLAKRRYNAAMDKFSRAKKDIDSLNAVLKGEPLSQAALMKNLFSGTNSANRIQAVKRLVKEEDPQLWHDMTMEFMTDVMEKHRVSGSSRVKWDAVKKELTKDPEVFNTLIEGTSFTPGQVKELLDIASVIDKSWKKASPQQKIGLVKRMALFVLTPFLSTKAEQVENVFRKVTGDSKVLDFLTNNTEEIIESISTAEGKSSFRQLMAKLSREVGRATERAVREDAPRELTESLARQQGREIDVRLNNVELRPLLGSPRESESEEE